MFGMPHTEYWTLQQETLDRHAARSRDDSQGSLWLRERRRSTASAIPPVFVQINQVAGWFPVRTRRGNSDRKSAASSTTK